MANCSFNWPMPPSIYTVGALKGTQNTNIISCLFKYRFLWFLPQIPNPRSDCLLIYQRLFKHPFVQWPTVFFNYFYYAFLNLLFYRNWLTSCLLRLATRLDVRLLVSMSRVRILTIRHGPVRGSLVTQKKTS